MSTILLAHDHFLDGEAKTAEALLRYGRDEVTGVVDRSVAKRQGPVTASQIIAGARHDAPVVATMEEALESGPDRLVIGVAPVGGRLPRAWHDQVRRALQQGVDVDSGLHDHLAQDPVLAEAAREGGAAINDVRRPPSEKPIYSGRVLELPCEVVLTVGTDCSSGKMTTAVELVRALRERGVEAAFAATGQTGILVGAEAGVVVDAVPADFVAGWTERLVLQAHEATGADVVVVEGQGALTHPAYAGVSLGLLHGASPSAAILCHDPHRRDKGTRFHEGLRFPVERPQDEWALVHRLASVVREPRLLGISAIAPTDDHRQRLAQAFHGVPVVDVLADGPGELATALEALT